MPILLKIIALIVVAFLVLCSVCVTIAALFSPKEYKGDGKITNPATGMNH